MFLTLIEVDPSMLTVKALGSTKALPFTLISIPNPELFAVTEFLPSNL